MRERTEAILAASDPRDSGNPATWPRWTQLMPHLLAADLAATSNSALRLMACNACWYLLARGDTRSGHDLPRDLHQHWQEQLGADHKDTLMAGHYFASASRMMGRYAEALDLDQDTLERSRRVLGAGHPYTLAIAASLAEDLRLLGGGR